jgi:hypothetical protein
VKKPRGRMQEHPKSHETLNQAVPYNLETTQPTMSDPRNPHCPIPIPPDSRFGRDSEMGRESVSRFSRERESGSRGRRAGGRRDLSPLGCARGGAGLFDTSTRPPLAQSPVAPGDFRVGGVMLPARPARANGLSVVQTASDAQARRRGAPRVECNLLLNAARQ